MRSDCTAALVSICLANIGNIGMPTSLRAQAPGDTVRLTPMVVTATRLATPVASLANAVTVLDGATLRRAGIVSVVEALRGVPSLAFAQAGSRGAQTSMFLRGGESDYVRVLVDGVPLNQAGGAIDMASLGTENVERIEIVRGPASVLYGSDAMTGVIQIITRHGGGLSRLTAEARGGNRGGSVASVEASAGSGRAALSGGLQREATRGVHDLNNRYENTSASGRLSLTPDARTDIQVTGRFRDGTYHYPTDGSGTPSDSNQLQRSRQTALSVDAGRTLGRSLELRGLLTLAVSRDSTDDRPDSPGDTLGFYASESRRDITRRGADVRVNARLGGMVLTPGVAVELERVRNRSSYQSNFGPGNSPEAVLNRTNRAAYLQASGGRGPLAVQAGLRLDDNQRFGNFTTWRLGASARLAPLTRLRASAGTAFKEPTFDENYSTAFSVGNPDLKPERSTSVEAGIEQVVGGRVSVSATAFTQRFRDLIQYRFSLNPTDTSFFNVASARASGVEVELRGEASRAVSFTFQYTFTHTATADSGYDGTVFAPGKRLLRRPTHLASLALETRPSASAIAGARVFYVGDRDDVDFSLFQRVVLKAYGRLDVWGRVAVLRGAGGTLSLTARAENVTGATYQEVFGFRTPGRRILVGARVDAGLGNR